MSVCTRLNVLYKTFAGSNQATNVHASTRFRDHTNALRVLIKTDGHHSVLLVSQRGKEVYVGSPDLCQGTELFIRDSSST